MSHRCRTFLLLAALCLSGCSAATDQAPIRLGHVATLSGPDRDAGQSAARGIRLAVLEANKQPDQVAGRKVEVIHTDTLGQLDAFEAEAVRLVSVNRVRALLGGTTPEQAERLELARVPVVSPSGVRPRSRSEIVFCTGLSPERQGHLLARFAAERLKPARLLVLADQARDSSVALAEAFVRAYQKVTTKDSRAPAERPTVVLYGKEIKLSEIEKRVRSEKPAAVFLAGTLADLRQLRLNLGEKAPPLLFGGEDASAKALREDGGKAAVYVLTAFTPDADVARVREFAKTFRATFGEEADVHAALAYDDARLVFEALRQTRDNQTGAALRDALAKIKDIAGVTGPLSFGEDRVLRRPAFVLRVENGQAKTEKAYTAAD